MPEVQSPGYYGPGYPYPIERLLLIFLLILFLFDF